MTLKHSWVPDRRDLITYAADPKSSDLQTMLVLSHQSFNERTGTVIGMHVSKAAEQSSNPFAIAFTGKIGARRYDLHILGNHLTTLYWKEKRTTLHPLRQL